MAGTIAERLQKQKQAREMHENGASMGEIARAFGVTRPAVRYWLQQTEEKLTKKVGEHAEIVAAYADGHTMAEIGAAIGLTGERVRQILKLHGIAAVRRIAQPKPKCEDVRRRKEARVARLWGVTLAEYLALKTKYGANGESTSPLTRYMQQRRNAKTRKIAWKLTFAEWWSIWQSSGKWNKRGRGDGYCMARFGDKGPYAIGNVEIIPTKENSRQARIKTLSKTF